MTKATPVRDEHGAVVLAVNIIEDVTDARLAERQQRFLSAASMLVSSSLDIDVTLDKVAGAAVPELADWCCVDVPDERGVVRRAAPRRRRRRPRRAGARARRAARWTPTTRARPPTCCAPGAASSSGTSTTPRRWPGPAATRSAPPCCAPATRARRWSSRWWRAIAPSASSPSGPRTARGGWARPSWRWPPSSARRAGIAVENARLHAARSHIATTLQRSLLPPRPAHRAGRHHRRALSRRRRDERGRRRLLRRLRRRRRMDGRGRRRHRQGPDRRRRSPRWRATRCARRPMYERSPSAVLARLNAALAADPDRRQICTAVCARIEPAEDGTLRVALARGGHPPPYLISAAGGAEPVGTPGPLLGAFDGGDWEEQPLRRRRRRRPRLLHRRRHRHARRGRRASSARSASSQLLDGRRALDADEVASRIDDALQAFEHGQQRDDVALLVLRAGGGDPRWPAWARSAVFERQAVRHVPEQRRVEVALGGDELAGRQRPFDRRPRDRRT